MVLFLEITGACRVMIKVHEYEWKTCMYFSLFNYKSCPYVWLACGQIAQPQQVVENRSGNILQSRGMPFMVHVMLFLFKWVVMRIGFCLFLQSITLLSVVYVIFNLVYLGAFTLSTLPTSNNIILCNVHRS